MGLDYDKPSLVTHATPFLAQKAVSVQKSLKGCNKMILKDPIKTSDDAYLNCHPNNYLPKTTLRQRPDLGQSLKLRHRREDGFLLLPGEGFGVDWFGPGLGRGTVFVSRVGRPVGGDLKKN